MEKNPNGLTAAQACRWRARLRAPDCDWVERQAFRQWLERDTRNETAYRRVRQFDKSVSDGAQMDSRLRAMADEALAKRAPRSTRAPVSVSWRIAATVLVAVGVVGLLATRGLVGGFGSPAVTSYENADLQQRRIELSDGSVVHLDVGSSLKVQMGRSERRLELVAGRAYFEVAHDASRPFTVTAAGTRTVALGTRFQVALAEQAASVTLAQGSVAISNDSNGNHWRAILRPGEQLSFDVGNGQREVHRVDAEAALGWSEGRLQFAGAPLGEALEEINRYAAVKIHLGDATLAARPIGGTFVAGSDSEQIAEALAAVMPLRIVHVGAGELVLFQRYETAAN